MKPSELNEQIAEFITASRELNGKEVSERPIWNHAASADAVRHFAYGISDDNPLWTDPVYASKGPYGRLIAPPSFLTSVLYPILHGAPLKVPMRNLIAGLEFEWYLQVCEGDRLHASAKQIDVHDRRDSDGSHSVYILSETRYWNQSRELVAIAKGTMVRIVDNDSKLLVDRQIYRYRDEELATIRAALKEEKRTAAGGFYADEIKMDEELPQLVRGPLTIGDLVCWQAAIGPSYRAARLGFLDGLESPHSTVYNPITGWPVKDSQQHEDFLLASQRGMPAPFDNGVMRFAWLSPLVTNWMGDNGILKKLSVRILAPNLYGDTTWYRGRVTKKSQEPPYERIHVKLAGINQLGTTTTAGEAEVLIPLRKKIFSSPGIDGKSDVSLRHKVPSSNLSLPERIEQQADKNPEVTALLCGDQSVSYAQMNRRANRLARYLNSLAVGPNVSVGVLLDRSIEAIVSFLAVLKAGGAYVPLDPNYPSERLDFMIEHSCVLTILSTRNFATKLKGCKADVVYLDDIEEALFEFSDDNLVDTIQLNAPAYVMYTSGSTEYPKGVSVPHESLSTYIDSLQESIPIKPDDRYVHTASFSFSASVRQTWLPLCKGAASVIADEEQRRDPLALFDLMKSQRVSIWDTVPTYLQSCVATLTVQKNAETPALSPNPLRLILTTGEPLSWRLCQRSADLFEGETQLMNLYSQTETAGTVCCYLLPKQVEPQAEIVPLGRPLEHCPVYVLDDQLHPVAEGESGEIYVGGRRLSSHYIRQPDLTAERLVPDAFSGEFGSRLYRTGDLGRYRKDGILEILGRRDNRLKIRGFRIEPEEISRRLSEHPQVENALVVSRDNGHGHSRLVAYVVTKPEAASTIRGFRRRVLPNGLAIAEMNRHETDYSYQGIFNQQTYLRHGISIRDGDCIFDVGANIGLFSLFAVMVCSNATIYSFEPNPQVFPILQANASLYAPNAKVANFGLSCEPKSASFTSYAGWSLLSGFYPDIEREQQVVSHLISNLRQAMTASELDARAPDESIVVAAISGETYLAPLKTLSMVIREKGINRIHLLKINAQKSELDVLCGVSAGDWSRIEQIVVKTDTRANLERILALLKSKGYDCEVEQDMLLNAVETHTVYGIHTMSDRILLRKHKQADLHCAAPRRVDPILSTDDLKSFLREHLPEYMVPASIVALEQFPLTPSGKIDYSRLPPPPELDDARGASIIPPRDFFECLIAELWQELLEISDVSISDTFIGIGGDSILALQFINRLREKTGTQLSVANVFLETLEQLAEDLRNPQPA